MRAGSLSARSVAEGSPGQPVGCGPRVGRSAAGRSGVPPCRWKRVAQGAFACGLAVVLAANLGKQVKRAARAELLCEVRYWLLDF